MFRYESFEKKICFLTTREKTQKTM